jgi:hypothetical protein
MDAINSEKNSGFRNEVEFRFEGEKIELYQGAWNMASAMGHQVVEVQKCPKVRADDGWTANYLMIIIFN